MRASGRQPICAALAAVVTITAEAPSLSLDELAAVTVPAAHSPDGLHDALAEPRRGVGRAASASERARSVRTIVLLERRLERRDLVHLELLELVILGDLGVGLPLGTGNLDRHDLSLEPALLQTPTPHRATHAHTCTAPSVSMQGAQRAPLGSVDRGRRSTHLAGLSGAAVRLDGMGVLDFARDAILGGRLLGTIALPKRTHSRPVRPVPDERVGPNGALTRGPGRWDAPCAGCSTRPTGRL